MKDLALKKAIESGLVYDDFVAAGIEYHDEEKTREKTGYALHSLDIPYFDTHGKETGYYRTRFLTTPQPKPVAEGEKERVKAFHKYSQPSGTAPHIYFPKGGKLAFLP